MAVEYYVPKEVSSILDLVDTYLRSRQASQKGDRKYHMYHPSEWGKCLRAQQYKHYAQLGLISVEYSDVKSQMLRIWGKGHNMHNRWSHYFDDMGNILLGRWKCKNPFCSMFDAKGAVISSPTKSFIDFLYAKKETRIYGGDNELVFRPERCVCGCSDFEYLESTVLDKSVNIKGHADIVLDCTNMDVEQFKNVRSTFNRDFLPINGKKVVIDMKTIRERQWKNQLIAKGPHKEYLVQLTIYCHILDCDYGMLIYENKDNSEIRSYIVPRNDEWWEIIRYQAKTMMQMTADRKLPPPKPLSKTNWSCKNCEFRDICHKSKIWQDPNLADKRRKFYKSLL